MSHVMCVLMIMCHVLFLLRGRALQWPASPPGQCLCVDNWVKIPPINVGVCHKSTQSKQCPGRVCPVPADQCPATLRAEWPMGLRGSGWGVVTCCHGAPTFLSRPPDVDVSVPVLTCVGQDWRHLSNEQDRADQGLHHSAETWSDWMEIRSRNTFYDKTLHWHWSLSVVCAGPWSLVM